MSKKYSLFLAMFFVSGELWCSIQVSKTKGFRLEFPEGYQYYSKPVRVN
jgi:hypothetical protein